MEWKKRLQEQARFYTEYATELQKKFEAGYLAELTPYRQFIVWKTELIDGKAKKLPFNPRTHHLASPTDPTNWGTLDDALKALSTGYRDTETKRWEWFNGIGFAFTKSDPFVGIDLDHCVHDNRRIDYRQEQLIRQIGSYAEYSPKDGVHLIVKARLPITTRKHGNLELFNSGHTMSLTLRHIPQTPYTIAERQAELDALTRVLVSPATEHPAPTVVWQEEADNKLTEVEKRQIEHWKSQPGNFKRYYEGDASLWAGSDKLVHSKSEADFVLVLMLLSRTQDNVEQTKRLFRASGLFDEKTDRISGHDQTNRDKTVTYLEITIFNALKKRKPR